ncbi:MAG TPA: iron hydrogenase small subunit [Smithella sp.]|jgi:ferredoxin hydrogenase small subunit|nr:iron hydrogenase small subunit [Smithella sp.]NMC96580.1 iron hydrogenase [Deltaproteobacteria bacterium]OQC54645.1 MAG: Periplasmic (Fe) hydrogenase small subunit precursor [Deltaproteobacteria bacterium ADurb.Bin022]HOG12194.1 iron hydrogenase small subunit [Smithellaceae bacterium]HOQ72191.1 iron hydrogenase small subunit [Smithellaceae bacterium]
MEEKSYQYMENPLHVTRREFITIGGIVIAFLALPAVWFKSIATSNNQYIQARTKGLYQDDEKSAVRVSHANQSVMRYYKEFGGEPLGHLSHELLHTGYINRSKGLI